MIATLATLTVVGSLARGRRLTEIGSLVPPPALTYEAALRSLFNDWIAGGLLIALSLTALAPGCYAGFLAGMRLHERFPRRNRTRWTLTSSLLACLLIVGGVGIRLYDVFVVVGGLIAPVLGAITADARRSQGKWAGPRRGWNRAGLAAWLVGVIAGLAPWLTERATGREVTLAGFSVLAAYVAAFLAYTTFAVLKWESVTEVGLFPTPTEQGPGPTSVPSSD